MSYNGNEAKAVTLEDLRASSKLVDESVLRILAENGDYVGAAHMQDNLKAFASGHGALQTYALFKASMDGVEAFAPLTERQLQGLMRLNAELGSPQGDGFKTALRQAALDISPEEFAPAFRLEAA